MGKEGCGSEEISGRSCWECLATLLGMALLLEKSLTMLLQGDGIGFLLIKQLQFEAYNALDPNENIKIKWDIMSWTPDGYVICGGNAFTIVAYSLVLLGNSGPTTSMVNPFYGGSTTHTPPNGTASSTFQSLQYILQQNTMQREQIITLVKFVGQTSEFGDAGISDPSQASAREKKLQAQVYNILILFCLVVTIINKYNILSMKCRILLPFLTFFLERKKVI